MAKETTPKEEPKKDDSATTPLVEAERPHCGIIMPISDSVGYDPGHWIQVRQLIVRAAEKVGFTATMVSENEGQDMIHASIIKNIYHNPVVVCDVSSLNPNVMLELGLRMATKKPLVLVFDSADTYPFDIKNFVYEGYPKGLHYFKIEKFVDNLALKIKQVYEGEQQGSYQPYLSHFNDVVIETSKLDVNNQTITDTLLNLVSDVKELKADFQSNQPKYVAQGSRNKLVVHSNHALTVGERTYIDFKIKEAIAEHSGSKNKEFLLKAILKNAEHGFFGAAGVPIMESRHRFEDIYPSIKEYILSGLDHLYSGNQG